MQLGFLRMNSRYCRPSAICQGDVHLWWLLYNRSLEIISMFTAVLGAQIVKKHHTNMRHGTWLKPVMRPNKEKVNIDNYPNICIWNGIFIIVKKPMTLNWDCLCQWPTTETNMKLYPPNKGQPKYLFFNSLVILSERKSQSHLNFWSWHPATKSQKPCLYNPVHQDCRKLISPNPRYCTSEHLWKELMHQQSPERYQSQL